MSEGKHSTSSRGVAAGVLLGLILLAGAAGAGVAQVAAPKPPTAALESPPEAAPADAEAAPAETSQASPPEPVGPLLIASWGGVYSQSQEEAVFRPFTKQTGIEITRKVYAGGLNDIRGQVTSRQMIWDVVDMEPEDLEEGCREGLLTDLTTLDLAPAPDGTPAAEDFLPGTLHRCAIGSLAWSVAIAYRDRGEERADEDRPSTLQDFFDLDRFPGRRGLRRTPMVNLEWALLADGVPPGEVYSLLRSEAGLARAFAKLDTIRDEVVWWDDARDPARLLTNGRVAMTSTFNAPMFNDIVVREQPFAMIWDRQVWDIDLWAVPTIAPNKEAALAFVRFATSAERLARQTRWIPYGPVRRSSIALVEDYVHAEVQMVRYLPTAPDNFETALRFDALFWREQGPALVDRFNAWLTR